jgi:DNA-binding IclR family transcriptional regulator
MKIDKQSEILRLLYEQGGTATKKEINDLARAWYYLNADKHIQAVLATMVRNKLIHRPSKGCYYLGPATNSVIQPVDPNQLNLFQL